MGDEKQTIKVKLGLAAKLCMVMAGCGYGVAMASFKVADWLEDGRLTAAAELMKRQALLDDRRGPGGEGYL